MELDGVDRRHRCPEQPTLTNVLRPALVEWTLMALAPCRKPDEVARAFALCRGAHIDLVHLEPGLAQSFAERRIRSRRPNRQHAARSQRPVYRLQPFRIV